MTEQQAGLPAKKPRSAHSEACYAEYKRTGRYPWWKHLRPHGERIKKKRNTAKKQVQVIMAQALAQAEGHALDFEELEKQTGCHKTTIQGWLHDPDYLDFKEAILGVIIEHPVRVKEVWQAMLAAATRPGKENVKAGIEFLRKNDPEYAALLKSASGGVRVDIDARTITAPTAEIVKELRETLLSLPELVKETK